MKIKCTISSLEAKNTLLKPYMPTNNGLTTGIREYAGTLNGNMWDGIWTEFHDGTFSETKLKPHHLYLIGDEKVNIHDNEWYLDGEQILQRKNSFTVPISKTARKIMASTNEYIGVPIIGIDFLKEYFTKRYHNQRVDKVLLEVEFWDEDHISSLLHCDAKNEFGFAVITFE